MSKNNAAGASLAHDETTEEMIQFVGFSVQKEIFAVDIQDVQEINKLVPITHVPRASKFVEGVINLRGQIVPVINLRERFSIEKIKYDRHTRIIIINLEDKRVGLIVDSVSEVLRIPVQSIKDAPEEAIGDNADFVKGIADVNGDLVIIIDLSKILTEEELQNIDKIKKIIAEKQNEE